MLLLFEGEKKRKRASPKSNYQFNRVPYKLAFVLLFFSVAHADTFTGTGHASVCHPPYIS